ncbi:MULTISPECIES: DUF1934 domain-containing protein [Bacillaceae]|uniref:DUF1934 domain-containing protein n=1 Tax=Bacillaceae TaxID=186817 RepID=UPI000BA45306|nr:MULTISPECIES: DUF1934 domain-containing protein [Bacillaceae]AWI13934.1 DUF1934 domain-containing protein [Caldibacillus thermoamylovorans]MED3643462.1 DUF1934 domain-containing protein [Caldifermentibacillus hisashii]PAC34996.1 hypothetical protein CEJ87_11375 [Caldifermentibacillus hisashii]
MKTSGTPVKITLDIHINRDGHHEDFEFIVFGHYYKRNATSYYIYDEVWENGKTHTIVKYIDGKVPEVQILRTGTLNMRLFFKENEVMKGSYKTNIGTFKVETSTKDLEYDWDEQMKQGKMNINYHFFIEQIEVGTYQLQFTFKEEKGL